MKLQLSAVVAVLALGAGAATVVSSSTGGAWESAAAWQDGRVPVAGDDVVVRDAKISVTGALTVRSLTVEGKGELAFSATPVDGVPSTPENLFARATEVKVLKAFRILDEARVTVRNDPKSGAAVKFVADTFRLAAGATVSADGGGWFWYESAGDPLATHTQGKWQTRALGAGGDDVPHSAYNRGGGYGADGGNANAKYGKAYGSSHAPFLPGSPNGIYNNIFGYTARPGGTVWIVAHGTMELFGKISSNGEKCQFGTPTGGGIWLAAKGVVTGPTAYVSASGGTLTGAAGYLSRGSGGRVSLALGLTDDELAALAGGSKPAGLRVFDSVGIFNTNVRGGEHPAAKKRGASGTETLVVGKLAEKFRFEKPDFVPDAEQPGVRRICLGHTVSNKNHVVWRWGATEYRLRLARSAFGGVKGVAEESWHAGTTGPLEAVPAAGYAFVGWRGDVPEEKRTANPLVLKLEHAAEVAPVFRPTDPARATLVAVMTNAVARFTSPVPISGSPEALGVAFDGAAGGGRVTLEVVDKSKNAWTMAFDAEEALSFPPVEAAWSCTNKKAKLTYPLALSRVEVAGGSAKPRAVRAVYDHELGRAARHFAANASRSRTLANATLVTDAKGVVVPMPDVPRTGVRFVLNQSKGSRLEIEWDTGLVTKSPIVVRPQTEKLLADFAGLAKGTPFTVEDSIVDLGEQRRLFVRPYFRPYRSNSEMVPMGYDYLADHEALPGAAAHVNDIVFERAPDGQVRLWWDGSYSYRLTPPRSLPKAKVRAVRFFFAEGVEYALKSDDAASLDHDRFTLVDFAANPRAKAFAGATYGGGVRAGVTEVGGVPIRLADPIDSGDVAICHQGKGSWALEVDEYTGRKPADGFGAAVHFRVPARDYVKAHLVFALDPDEKKDRILNVRLAQYFLNGAGSNMLTDSLLDYTKGVPSDLRRLGSVLKDGKELPLYAVTVDIDLKPMFDLVCRADYLDFEFMGAKSGSKPDAKRESAFSIFGATLESAPVTLDVVSAPEAPSNVFTLDEAEKYVTLKLRGERPEAKCRVTWSATAYGETKAIFSGSADVGPLAKGEVRDLRLDLAQANEPGLYLLKLDVDAQAPAARYDYTARFAVLPPAGRVVEKTRSPYATWWFFGSHGSPADWKVGGPIMQKAGIRKASHGNWPTNEMAKYDVTFTGNVRAPGMREFDAEKGVFKPHDGLSGEEWFVREVQKQIDQRPYVDHIMIWHESCPSAPIPEEILDLPVPAATEKDKAAGAYINEIGRLVRKHFPKLFIQIGNSSASLGAACLPFRGGADPQYYDAVGIETPSQTMMPERLLVWGLQGMMMTKEGASHYAKRPVPARACYEYVYRTERALGELVQAQWYMRDTLISLANGMTMISPAILFDVKNAYYDTLWGRAGMFYRAPYAAPKLSYVAYAALTKALDGVTLVRQLDTGSTTVYALLFRRADGKYATAVWCARGEAELKLDVAGAGEVMDMVGRTRKLGGLFGGKAVTASESPVYVITERPVEGVSIAKRGFAQAEATARDAKDVFRFQDVSSVSNAPDARIKSRGHGCLPIMRPSDHFALKAVDDPEKGKCLEVTLDTSAEKVNRYYTEYTTLRLKEPAEIRGPAKDIGIWVKGNSSWGQVRFEIEDAQGEVFVNYAHPTLWDTLDWQGLLCVNFDGWSYVSCRFDGGLRFDAREGLSNSPWSREVGSRGGDGKITFPVRLKAVTVGVNRMKLDLTDFKVTDPSVRLGAVSVRRP